MALVFLTLAFKSNSGGESPNTFGSILSHYIIEETSAYAINYVEPENQLADISSLKAFNSQDLGQGGEEDNGFIPSNMDDESLLSYNPVLVNYINVGGFRRNQITEYIVQPGDLLSFIASDYGVSVSSLIWSNNLRDADSISPNQVLKIPPVSGVIHEVKKGDTVASMAKKYSVDEAKIIEFNDLPSDGQLQVGDALVVPDGQVKQAYAGTTAVSAQKFAYLPNLGGYFMVPTTGFNWGRIHGRNGVDMANSCKTPIYAAADGVAVIVDAVGYNGGFGKFIKLVHPNGTETLYAHGSKLLINQGDSVSRGQLIALMGTTGRSTGCHLHFEVHGARNPLAKY